MQDGVRSIAVGDALIGRLWDQLKLPRQPQILAAE